MVLYIERTTVVLRTKTLGRGKRNAEKEHHHVRSYMQLQPLHKHNASVNGNDSGDEQEWEYVQ